MSSLTQLAPDLWLDLDMVIAVQTRTEKLNYARQVTLTTTIGSTHTITVPGTPGGGQRTVQYGDDLLAAWLRDNLAALLNPRTEQADRPDRGASE